MMNEKVECPFGEHYINKEGYIDYGDELVCLDWDARCTKCKDEHVGNENIYEFHLKGR